MNYTEASKLVKSINHTFRALTWLDEILEAAASAEQSLREVAGARDAIQEELAAAKKLIAGTKEAHERAKTANIASLKKQIDGMAVTLKDSTKEHADAMSDLELVLADKKKAHEGKLLAISEEKTRRQAELGTIEGEVSRLNARLRGMRTAAQKVSEQLEEAV